MEQSLRPQAVAKAALDPLQDATNLSLYVQAQAKSGEPLEAADLAQDLEKILGWLEEVRQYLCLIALRGPEAEFLAQRAEEGLGFLSEVNSELGALEAALGTDEFASPEARAAAKRFITVSRWKVSAAMGVIQTLKPQGDQED